MTDPNIFCFAYEYRDNAKHNIKRLSLISSFVFLCKREVIEFYLTRTKLIAGTDSSYINSLMNYNPHYIEPKNNNSIDLFYEYYIRNKSSDFLDSTFSDMLNNTLNLKYIKFFVEEIFTKTQVNIYYSFNVNNQFISFEIKEYIDSIKPMDDNVDKIIEKFENLL